MRKIKQNPLMLLYIDDVKFHGSHNYNAEYPAPMWNILQIIARAALDTIKLFVMCINN